MADAPLPNLGDVATSTVAQLADDVSCMALQLAQDRLAAMQAASATLDSRCAQVAAALLAAAALAASLAVSDRASTIAVIWGSAACILFVVGSAVAFIGVQAAEQQLPGVPASWWAAVPDKTTFSASDARAWLAGRIEDAIIFNDAQDTKRSRALNASLLVGLLGGLAVGVASISQTPMFSSETHSARTAPAARAAR